MSERCAHGEVAGDCLICQALGLAPAATATKERSGRRRSGKSGGTPVQTAQIIPATTSRRSPGRSITARVSLLLVALVGVALIIFFIAGFVFTILHLIELILVAVAAGWLGYHLGHWRGRRERGA